MIYSYLKSLFLVLFISVFSLNSKASDYINGQLFVQLKAKSNIDLTWDNSSGYKPHLIIDKLVSEYQITKIHSPFLLQNEALKRTYLFEFKNTATIESLINKLESIPEVEYAELVPKYETFYVPNDPQYSSQWHLQTIQAEQAWDIITTQTSNVTIAVVDDAVLTSHSDLAPNIWTNSNEIAFDGIDNDANGYIDDVNGWDAADNDNNPNPDSPTNSFFTHGTHCAGIASARTDNSNGISSLGYHAKIMPVKTSTLPNPGAVIAGYAGVEYAIINQADVISMSWGGPSYSATYQIIFDQAYNQGIVCVAAAGNSNSSAPMYPASYNHVISVGATDQNDQRASFSNYGSTIDVMAPGVAIYSSLAGSNTSYGNLQGTSMACPLVASLAAMLIACDSTLNPDDVENCIESTSDDIYPLNSGYINQLGAGRINAYNAVVCAKALVANFTSNFEFSCPSQSIQFNDISGGSPTTWNWSFPGGSPATSTLQNPIISYNSAGTYDVTLIVSDGTNNDTIVKTNYMTVGTPLATLSGNSTIILGYTGYIEFNFTGNLPWSVTYTDGISNYTVNNIVNSPYYHPIVPLDTSTYSILNFSDTLCTGAFSGTATINVLPQSAPSTCYYTKYFGDSLNNTFTDFDYDFFNDEIYAVGSHDSKALFTSHNPNGDLNFAISIPGLSGSFSDIASAPNGDRLCLSNFNEDITVVRISNTGNVIWAKRYSLNRERRIRIIQSTGDTYIIACWYSTGGSSDDATFMRIDGSGNIIWTTRFHSIDDQIYDIVPNGLGGAVFSGGIHGAGSVDMFVGEIDVNGVFLDIAEYNHSTNAMNEALLVHKTINNEYLTASQINGQNAAPWDVNLMRLDANFDKIWEVNFTNPNGRVNSIDEVIEDLHGNIYVSCRFKTTTPDISVVVKFDSLGNYIWSKEVSDTRALKLRNTNSTPVDNLLALRFYNGNSGFGLNDCFITRTDTALNSCSAVPIITSFTSGVSTKTPLPHTVSTLTFSVTSLILNESFLQYQNGVICDSCNIDTTCLNVINPDFTNTIVCLGDSTLFNDISTTTSGNINSWNWNFDDGTFSYGIANPSHLFLNPGIYDVLLTVSNDTIPTCFDSIAHSVEVVTHILTLPNDTVICLGDSITLNSVNLLCGSSIGWNFTWSPGNSMNNPNLQQPTVSPSVTTTYYLVATNPNGTIILNDSITILVNQNCCVSQPNFIPNSLVCGIDTIQFTNTSISNGPAIYHWNFGINATPSTFNGFNPPLVNFNNAGTFPVSLTQVDNCGSNTIIKNIIITPLPSVNTGFDTIICFADSVQIGDSLMTAGMSYNWSPGNLVSDSTITNPFAYINSTTNLILEVTDNWTGCIATDTITITIPIIDLVLIPFDTICFGDTIILDAGNGANNANYLWQDGSTSQFHTASDSGLYIVEIEIGGCIQTDTTELSVQTINVNFSTINTSGCAPLYIPFTGNGNVNFGSIDYWAWDFGDGNYASIKSPVNTFSLPGVFDVSLTGTTNFGCSISELKQSSIETFAQAIATFDHSPNVGRKDDLIQFTNHSENSTSWIWNFGDNSTISNDKNVTHTYSEPGQYTVTLIAQNEHNCNDSTSYTINILDELLIYAPNVMTLDGNGNQTWKFQITGIAPYDFNIKIYNRWGELIWDCYDQNGVWDANYNGKEVQDGTYVWVMEFGDSFTDKRYTYNGHITVLK